MKKKNRIEDPENDIIKQVFFFDIAGIIVKKMLFSEGPDCFNLVLTFVSFILPNSLFLLNICLLFDVPQFQLTRW